MQEQQDMKPAYKQPSAKVRVAAIKAELRVDSQPDDGNIMRSEGETPIDPAWRRNRGSHGYMPDIKWHVQGTWPTLSVIERRHKHMSVKMLHLVPVYKQCS